MSAWIQTRSGKAVDLLNPTPDMIDFDDIAYALSRICRFTGHTKKHYSVAEHSVRVALILPEPIQFYGALHDAAEAYTGDNSSPLKAAMGPVGREILREITDKLDAAICEAFGIPRPTAEHHAAIKHADIVLLMTERRDLLGPSPCSWGAFENTAPLADKIVPWGADEAFRILSMCLRCANRGQCRLTDSWRYRSP